MLRPVAWAAVALVLSASNGGPQNRFAAVSRLVRLDVLVTQNGAPLQGLSMRNFEVLDNGVLQQLSFVTGDRAAVDVVVVLDTSSSVRQADMSAFRQSALRVLDALEPTDRAAVVTAGVAVSSSGALVADRAVVRGLLRPTTPALGTSLIDALAVGLQTAATASGPALVLVLSDGLDTTSILPASSVLRAARRASGVVYSVVPGTGPALLLRDLSQATGGRLVRLQSIAQLDAALLAVVREFRQRYVIGFESSEIGVPGWHTVEVKLKGQRATITTRQGYFVR